MKTIALLGVAVAVDFLSGKITHDERKRTFFNFPNYQVHNLSLCKKNTTR